MQSPARKSLVFLLTIWGSEGKMQSRSSRTGGQSCTKARVLTLSLQKHLQEDRRKESVFFEKVRLFLFGMKMKKYIPASLEESSDSMAV